MTCPPPLARALPDRLTLTPAATDRTGAVTRSLPAITRCGGGGRLRHLLLVALIAWTACGQAPDRTLHGRRNLAYLHAMRDSDAGHDAAITILQDLVGSSAATFEDALNLARALILHSKRGAAAGAAIARARALGSDAAGLAALDYVDGLFHKAKQDHGRAHQLFQRVLQVHPDHPEALYQCGYAAELADRLPDARRHYQRLIDLGQLVRPAAYRLSKTAAALGDKALEQQAIALFMARDKNEKPETTKCDLTDVSLRRFDRSAAEPPRLQSGWATATVRGPEPIQQVLPCPGARPGTVEVLLVGTTKVWVRPADRPPQATAITLRGAARGLVLDLDNKAGAEVVLFDDSGVRAFERGPDGGWQAATVEFPAAPGGAPASLAAFDHDHDGDLDIVLATGGSAPRLRVLRNRGDRRFEWRDPFAAPLAANGAVRLDAHDLDQANDLDLVFPGPNDQGAVLALNLRGDRYRQVPLPQLAGRTVFVVEDFDNDGAPDIFAAGGAPGWTVLRNADPAGRRYQVRFAAPVTRSNGVGLIHDAVPVDLDNDGDLDLLLGTTNGLLRLHNTAGNLVLGSEHAVPGGAHRLTVADLDSNGVADVLAVSGDQQLVRFQPQTQVYPALQVAPEGRKDNRSAVGTVAEIYADRLFQSRMIKGPFGVRFGLGLKGFAGIDGLRLRWPQGIRQAVPVTALEIAGGRAAFRQIEGLVASCPFLYVDGEQGWRFQTDVLGIAPLAEWMRPGQQPHLDPEEYIRIPGQRLVVRDGKARLAITEELKETTYLDRIELLFHDHPADRVLLIDENLLQGAYDPLRIQGFATADIHGLARATAGGVDRTADLAERDRRYLHPYGPAPSQWGGWCPPHTMELVTAADADVLLLEGRLGWYDSTVSYALAQNGRGWQPMQIDRVLPDGDVERLVDDAGGPTGMDRTMVVSLGRVVPSGSRLRITAQHRFLWDRIRTARSRVAPAPPTQRAALTQATLYHHGYSAYIGDPGGLEQSYDFDDRSPDDRYPRARGFTNEYGDVRALVAEHDDALAILVAGDAIAFEFDAPPVPAGMVRTWFLRLSGWAKESGFHNLTGEEIAPLPFRGMTAYPPPPGERSPWRAADQVLTRRIR